MALDRTTIIRGPAQIEYPAGSGHYFYSQGDIRVSIGHDVFPITNSSFGHVQDRSRQRTATVSFTPVGQFLTPLWPYGTYKSGDSLLGNTDNNMVIWSYKGTKATIYNVAITKMPDLILSTTKTLAGEVTFTGLGKGMPSLVAQETADSFVSFSEGNGAPTENFSPNTVITQPYSASWNTSTNETPTNTDTVWGSLYTKAGWHITFDMNFQPVEVDSHGIVDWTVGDVRATARAQLLGISEAQATAAVHPYIARGGAMDTSNDLIITGANTAIVVTLYGASARMVPTQYGLTTERLAEMEFSATRKIVSNAVQAMFSVTGPSSPF